MKDYIAIKRIKARPMRRGPYNIHRGWDVPLNENPMDEGYLVEHEDGYESWSPKELFEKTYSEIETDSISFWDKLSKLGGTTHD